MKGRYKKMLMIGLDAALPDLIKKFSAEGAIPNITSLIERGATSRVTTVFPPLTAAAWSAIVTGAGPGTAGVPSLMVKLPGEELDEWHTSFDRRMVLAETLWESAARDGMKSVLVNWPVTWPKGGYENTTQIAAALNPPFRYFYMPIWDVAGSGFYSTEQHYCNQIPGRAVRIKPEPAEPWTGAPSMKLPALEFEIDVPPVYAKGHRYVVLVYGTGSEYDRVRISKTRAWNDAVADLAVSEISDWQTEMFVDHNDAKRTGRFRFQLIKLSKDATVCKLYTWAINTAESYTIPEELTVDLEKAVGPYLEVDDPWAYLDEWVEMDHYVEQCRIHSDWFGNATKYALETQEWDLAFTWVGTVDHMQHVLYAGIVPESMLYDPDKYDFCMDHIRIAYQQVDENIGKILSAVDLDETMVVLVSDHGFTHNDWNPYLKHFLVKAGLLHYDFDAETGQFSVDWSRSKCHPLEPSHAHIFINVKGRDPHGIVEPEDYESVQEEIKRALYGIKDPQTGESAMAAVLTKQEATTVGIYEGPGWDRIGDILFAFKPGYLANTFIYPSAVKYADGTERIIPNQEEHEPSILGRHFSGAHVTLPGIKEMEALIIMAGAGFQPFERDNPMDIVDIAPTLAHVLGMARPKDAEGSIVPDIVEHHGNDER